MAKCSSGMLDLLRMRIKWSGTVAPHFVELCGIDDLRVQELEALNAEDDSDGSPSLIVSQHF